MTIEEHPGGFVVTDENGVMFCQKISDSQFRAQTLSIKPDRHGKGFGTAIYLAAKQEAERRGCTLVHGYSDNPAILAIRKKVFTKEELQ